ncbi:alpha-(1,3)-fucosyltransferase C-like [Saccostrea echinata]|uniref:alpha-(1,3)-fucosyltransferase C-like n=1 Tax=Saccostrea echinata TaxID=191078 RepID=UPI002A828218|nr:alpha-(1,3)-fucosyltransferase C-like [Saccostrea echinata]
MMLSTSGKRIVRNYLIVLVLLVTVSISWIKVFSQYDMNIGIFDAISTTLLPNSNRSIEEKNIISDKRTLILVYNAPSYLTTFIDYFNKRMCSTTYNCFVSQNVEDFQNSIAVIFNIETLPKSPPQKIKNQFWIFHSMEPATLMKRPARHWNGLFDYTMSFRSHSDIFRPYGSIKRRQKELERNYSDVFRKKTLDAVWMSGHCPVPSKRRALAQEIGKHIHVDLFGECGTQMCGIATSLFSECLANVSRDYKFYLAFENTICPDYTTEKLFNLYLYELEIIPVVNGPSNVADYLPNGTYIDALRFATVKDLANMLIDIGSSEEKYTNYLKEKDKYYEVGNEEIFSDAICKICEKSSRNRNGETQDYWTRLLKDNC